jgi:hypothetical protein
MILWDSLNASTGDVIEIRGKRKTVAKCLPLYPSDEGKGIIRVDGLVRNNAGVAVVRPHIGDIIAYQHGLHFCQEVYPYRNQNKV